MRTRRLAVLFLTTITGTCVWAAAPAGYLFTMPRRLWKGTKEKLCITRHEEGERYEYNLDLVHDKTNSTTTYIFESGNSQCWNFDVPNQKGSYTAILSGSDGMGNNFRHETFVKVQESQPITLIQCDKPMYKPGQTVKFRIMTINDKMIPQTEPISVISIENPGGIRVRQWRDVDVSMGLASLEMKLSADPTMGKWMIKAEVDGKNTHQTFIVQEYVLPKFEVTATPPTYLLPDSPTIDGKVCAKYTYGKPVKGLMGLEICYEDQYIYYGPRRDRDYARPCYRDLVEIDGCHTFSVNSSELSLSSRRYNFWGTLKIRANITEQGTGVTLYGESVGPEMTQRPFSIDITDETKNYFKPAFPYRVKITAKKPDGSPAAGELIEVFVRNWEWDFFRRQNFTTNENGYFWFAVTDIPENVTSLNIQASSLRYQRSYDYYRVYDYHSLYQPQGYLSARRWYSPSDNYMHVQRVTETASCGQTLDVNVMYTAEMNSTHKFYYMVTSRRHVVYHNHHQYHFHRQDAIEINTVPESEKLVAYTPPPRRPYYYRPILIDIPVNETDNGTSDTEAESTPEPEPESEPEPEPEQETARQVAGFTLHIPVTAVMAPEAQLLVYYIRDDGETIADTVSFNIEKCFDNKVDMDFEEETVYPGNEARIRIKAAPGSYCSVGVVDKSINLLGGKHQLTAEKIYDMIPNPYFYYSYWEDDRNYCTKQFPEPDIEDDTGPYPYYYGYYFYDTNTVDAIQAFRELNLVVFTDLALETRPCTRRRHVPIAFNRFYDSEIEGEEGPVALLPDRANVQVTQGGTDTRISVKKTEARSHFPETFLWDLELIGEEGELVMTREVPHTITEWVGNTLCANTEVGIGTSPIATLTAFQPFFLSFTLPYSAVRHETIPVVVTVFNYLTECLVMLVRLEESAGFDLVSSEGRVQRCVCGGESSSIKYYIKPTVIGEIEILAAAESLQDDGTCGNNAVNDQNTGASDAVRRKLPIEAEGVEKDYTFSSYICTEGGSALTTIDLPLPPQGVVEDSARGKLNVIGDIMGPALSNLQDLLNMPYGCGEQNMASWSPNIVALQYLTNTNQLTKEIEEEALNYMRIGYQRQLRYRHQDSSYSAFGGSGTGSMWLTAFVVKCFGQSMPFIDIDSKDLTASLKWFRSKQLENGCFPKVGYTHSYYLKGGIGDGSNEAAMTAFVLIAMLEAGVSQNDESVVNAVQCLDSQDNNDTYTLALMAYAYTLYNPSYSPRLDVMAVLESRAQYKDDGIQKYWTRGNEGEETPEPYSYAWYRAPSAEVEITAYILLATIIGEQENAVVNAQPIVIWLTKQRNSRGGFSSTQDTIVALQALSVYATLVYSGGMDVGVTFRGIQNPEYNFRISTDNSLVLQQVPLEVVPDTLEAEVSGIGCALLQVNVKYNVDEVPAGPAFTAKVSAYRSKTKGNDCKRRTLQICVRFTGPGGLSNMAMVDVKMVTGWIPVTSTLESLLEIDTLDMEKYEVDGNMVHIYFSKLDRAGQCFYFDVEQDIEVDEPDKAFVKVYDYYETDLQVVIPYKLTTTCNKDDDLPISPVNPFFCGTFDEFVVMAPPGALETRTGILSTTAEPTPAPMTCPHCEDSWDSIFIRSSKFRDTICGAQIIYKAVAGRTGKYPMKIYTDIRTRKKTSVQRFANFEKDDSCSCDSIPTTESKIFVIARGDIFDVDTKKLILDDRTTVVPWSKATEKAIRRLVRRKRNGCS